MQAAENQRLASPQTRTCGTTASGSSKHRFVKPTRYPFLFSVHFHESAVASIMFPSNGSLLRYAASLLTGSLRTRFASLQTVLSAYYDFQYPVPPASLFASRLVIRWSSCSFATVRQPAPLRLAIDKPVCHKSGQF